MASETDGTMALATRCPQCATVFRVVADQIKLRGGWVRCGVCSTTFDAGSSLQEVELPRPVAPGPEPLVASAVEVVAEPHVAPADPDPILDHPAVMRTRPVRMPPLPDLDFDVAVPAPVAQPAPPVADRADALAPADVFSATRDEGAARQAPTFGSDGTVHHVASAEPVFRAEPRSHREPQIGDVPAQTLSTPARTEPAFVIGNGLDESVSATESPRLPDFMEKPPTRRSGLRWLWALAALLALLLLLGQAAIFYRSELATRVPALRPLLDRACGMLECTVAYPRDIRQLTVESSSLETWGRPGTGAFPVATDNDADQALAASDQPRRLALTVVLRNRAQFAQSWPAIELSLTDFSETVVARRVLLPSSYLPPQQLSEPLAAGVERTLRIPIETSQAKASGYRIAVFFP